MAAAEKFIEWVTNQAMTLTNAVNSVFNASGGSHSVGLVPDPGSSAGTTHFLREDATWQVPPTVATPVSVANGGTGLGTLTAHNVMLGEGTSNVAFAAPSTSLQPLLSNGASSDPSFQQVTAPTVQKFTSGSSQTYTPTTNTVRIRVRMVGGGGGGGGASANNGQNGGDTSFGSWTAIHGNGGTANNGAGGAGGTAGVNGTGTLIVRITGQAGSIGTLTASPGGNAAFFGGGGLATLGAGISAVANTGSGASGGVSGGVGGGAGGAGEYVEFWVTNPAGTTYTVGTGGSGGVAGGNAGGNGAAGIIIIEEFYI